LLFQFFRISPEIVALQANNILTLAAQQQIHSIGAVRLVHILFPIENRKLSGMFLLPGLEYLTGVIGRAIFPYEYLIRVAGLLHQNAVQCSGYILLMIKRGNIDADYYFTHCVTPLEISSIKLTTGTVMID
jgi:hypothetical protein